MNTEQALLDYLRTLNEAQKRLAFPRRYTPAGFLLAFGRFFRPQELPEGLERGDPNHCFSNAQKRIIGSAALEYAEGYALSEQDLPVHHGWCIDKSQRVLDFTWRKPGLCYFGVCFHATNILLMWAKYGESVAVLSDWRHSWPALDDDSWLEPSIHSLSTQ